MIRRAPSRLCALVPLAALLLTAGSAAATVIEATASRFTGDRLSVSLTVDDAAVPGDLEITLTVAGPGSTLADLRGFFVHVADESLLSGLSVIGPDVTSSSFLANAVSAVGPGNNLNGGGSPCPCDIGVELGTPGIARDDLQTVTFTLSHATASLDVSFLASQEFGIRATSVGEEDCRDGSSKLSGILPVPEPGTALLTGLGLAGLAAAGKRSPRR